MVNKIKQSCSEFISTICVVNDCSTDNTGRIASDAGAVVLTHKNNSGVGAAIRTGLDFALSEGYDIAVIISGDDQHKPEEMKSVLNPIINGDADFVQGSRFMKGGISISQPLFRKIFTKLYPWMFYLLTGKKCSDITNGFRAFRIKKVFGDPSINLHQEWLNKYELEVYLLYKVYTSKNLKRAEVPITIVYHETRSERTKMKPLIDWWRILRPMIYLKLHLKK